MLPRPDANRIFPLQASLHFVSDNLTLQNPLAFLLFPFLFLLTLSGTFWKGRLFLYLPAFLLSSVPQHLSTSVRH